MENNLGAFIIDPKISALDAQDNITKKLSQAMAVLITLRSDYFDEEDCFTSPAIYIVNSLWLLNDLLEEIYALNEKCWDLLNPILPEIAKKAVEKIAS